MSGGRGSENRQRTTGVFVRFTDDQLEMLRAKAERQGLTVPELLRDGVGIDRVAS